jgi:integrase
MGREMTLVVARVTPLGIRVAADMRLTDEAEIRRGFLHAALKVILLSPVECAAYAGNAQLAVRAILGPTDRVLWLTAAMTGLRQGELVGLRWRGVDWAARLVRVRRSYSRGQWTTPKSRRSSRAVPMADRVAAELERHFGRSAYPADDDRVFCHPQTGRPYDASKSRVRFKAALKRAELREVRFHDLRHTYGTLMAAAGAPLRTLQGWMGHRDYKTTEIYAEFAPDPSQGAVWAERPFGASSDVDGAPVDPGRLF